MNDVIELLYKRKSVRAYEEKMISKEDKDMILNAALQASTAGNMTLYTILDITDQKIKDKLVVTCDNQAFIAKAPMVLIFCADYRRWYNMFSKYNEDIKKPGAGKFFMAQADAIIAAQNAVIAAESLGIGSCYIGDIIENFEIHRELLKLPKYVVPACMLCFGYPDERQRKRHKPERFEVSSIVHENAYDDGKSSADAMEEMVNKRHGSWKNDSLADWAKRFYNYKHNSAFSDEMNRSAIEIIDSWIK